LGIGDEIMKNSDFDLDLKSGQVGETSVASLLSIDTVEVKRDFKWFDTGNLYIEFSCYNITQGKYVPSGIEITKASHWAFVLGDTVVLTLTDHIKNIIKNNNPRQVSNPMPPNPSKGYLIRITDILNYQEKQGPEITYV
jgi:hypothetical protein